MAILVAFSIKSIDVYAIIIIINSMRLFSIHAIECGANDFFHILFIYIFVVVAALLNNHVQYTHAKRQVSVNGFFDVLF